MSTRLKEVVAYLEQPLLGANLLGKLIRTGGVNFATGLPCGELKGLIDACGKEPELLHVPGTNEREAVGIAAGAWLGGKKPIIYMQNSGLFVSSNELGSIMIACKIPAVFVISWRGAPGETATQHFATGRATRPLLTALGIEYITEATEGNLDKLLQTMDETQLPVAILQVKEGFNTVTNYPEREVQERKKGELYVKNSPVSLSREEATGILLPNLDTNTAVFSSTGLISRSIFENYDGQNHFYNAGGLGATASLGLGFAQSQPATKIMVVEGDGSVLTDLGNLNLIGYYQPKNLLHIVLDNRALVSCSGEATIGSSEIPYLAHELGYQRVFSVTTAETVGQIFQDMLDYNAGPQMLHIRINTVGRRDFKRPLVMDINARRFKEHFSQ